MRPVLMAVVSLGLVMPVLGADREAEGPRRGDRTERRELPARPREELRGLQRTESDYALSPQQALWAKISEVKFEQMPLRDALAWLQETLGTNMHVDWGALAEAGVTPEQPININLKWVRVPRLLQLMFQETGRGDALTYYIADNILVITTRQNADAEVFTRVYPVQDLVIQPGKVDRPDREVLSPQINARGGAGARGGEAGARGGGEGLFGRDEHDRNNGGGGDDDDDDDEDSDKERGRKLIDMVKGMTPADIWQENGGKSRITYYRGNLILTAPRSVHALIGGPIRE
jgi:hypothetical protein